MPFKLAVTVTHGMGAQTNDFADAMIDEVKGRLAKLKVKPADVLWQSVFWADVLQPRQDKLWHDLSRDHDLDYVKIRRFVLSALADAVAYQRVPGPQQDVYEEVHACVRKHLQELRAKAGGQDLPVIVMAHSLGCAVMTDYIWDRQKETQAGNPSGTPTEQLDLLAGVITFGCNLPVFSLAYDPVMAIAFPPPTLPAALKPVAKWFNYFDPDDVLGYPLKPLSPSYTAAVTEDRAINAGGIFSSWNPLAHSGYWTDNDFTGPVAAQIAAVLKKL
jgi:hypothetical protein